MAERVSLARAERVAKALLAQLEPACERIVIAGSIRRRFAACGVPYIQPHERC